MGLPKPVCSLDDYLAQEREEEIRHEYLDGQVYAMAGETLEHSTISANIAGELHGQLKGKPCRVLSPNMKVLSGKYSPGQTKGMFSYPDVSVVCGEPSFMTKKAMFCSTPPLSSKCFRRGRSCLIGTRSSGATARTWNRCKTMS